MHCITPKLEQLAQLYFRPECKNVKEKNEGEKDNFFQCSGLHFLKHANV
jgi:hypothetical protein